jgi:hypothetical protein
LKQLEQKRSDYSLFRTANNKGIHRWPLHDPQTFDDGRLDVNEALAAPECRTGFGGAPLGGECPYARLSHSVQTRHRAPLRGDRFVWPVRLITDLGAVAIDPTMGCGDSCADRRRTDPRWPDRRSAAVSIGMVAVATVITVATTICITAVITAVVAAIIDLVELP